MSSKTGTAPTTSSEGRPSLCSRRVQRGGLPVLLDCVVEAIFHKWGRELWMRGLISASARNGFERRLCSSTQICVHLSWQGTGEGSDLSRVWLMSQKLFASILKDSERSCYSDFAA
jgi:hypothetical protein